ncbi:hypothetical protein ABW19_dt0209873 [Dactylella cylindrospora]|nr:hypothetical protein ABW19_dt0209873 [Dactylella cylindrospora]
MFFPIPPLHKQPVASILFFVSIVAAFPRFARGQEDILVFSSGVSEFKLASNQAAPEIWVSTNDFPGVQRTANDVAIDFGRIVNVNGTVKLLDQAIQTSKSVIIAGTIGKSKLIDNLISRGKINVSETKNKWEAYTTTLVQNPFTGVPWALVVSGSDQRGTIYGLYDISETMGVSPWYWWADVAPKKKTNIWVRGNARKVQASPSVKYRGFFINDEWPALGGWASEKYGSVPFNKEFYRTVFELCLRLKANYIWTAMWNSAFYVDDTGNGPLADSYGVFIGTSHHEPMARAEREQQSQLTGPWDWTTNKAEITEFFRYGAQRAKEWDTIFTMGMRGSGDAASPTLTAESLEDVIRTQQSILTSVFNTTSLAQIPQTWVLYKEVGQYYQAGMSVPDSITLLWTDDNAGNILRTPLTNETSHGAGAGVYYHFDYVGAPRNYKWINTIQLVKTWEQMHLAYEKKARQIWIANVGDIKPLEIPLSHFLDMAYDMSKHATPNSTSNWLKRWATKEFGSNIADVTANILNTYGKLLIRRKYELLSRAPFAYSVQWYDEAEKVLLEWSDLLNVTQATYNGLTQENRTPFFEMVLHPVLAGKTVVELYIKANLNAWRFRQRRTSTDKLANDVKALFQQDSDITDRYHGLKNKKWDGILNQPHIGYSTWSDPVVNTMPTPAYHGASNVPRSGIMGVGAQGVSGSAPGDPEPTLLSVDPYMPPGETRYLDIFTRNNGTFSFSITCNVSYVTVAKPNGTLSAPDGLTDLRNLITVNWSQAPAGLTWAGLRIRPYDAPGSWNITALLPVNKTSVPTSFKGYVESGGVVSIEAEHYSSAEKKNGLEYVVIPHYGRTLSGIKLWPVTASTQTPSTGPKLTYSFHTFTGRTNARVMIFLGASLNHDPARPLKYAFSIDGGTAVTVQPVPNTPMGSTPSGWTDAVIAGGWTSATTVNIPSGSHTLSLWLLEPGVVVQKVVIDLGGYKSTSLGPPESKKV